MPAPKGNKYAAKDDPKTGSITLRLRPEAIDKIKKMARDEKITITQVIEKALIAGYPKEFDDLL